MICRSPLHPVYRKRFTIVPSTAAVSTELRGAAVCPHRKPVLRQLETARTVDDWRRQNKTSWRLPHCKSSSACIQVKAPGRKAAGHQRLHRIRSAKGIWTSRDKRFPCECNCWCAHSLHYYLVLPAESDARYAATGRDGGLAIKRGHSERNLGSGQDAVCNPWLILKAVTSEGELLNTERRKVEIERVAFGWCRVGKPKRSSGLEVSVFGLRRSWHSRQNRNAGNRRPEESDCH